MTDPSFDDSTQQNTLQNCSSEPQFDIALVSLEGISRSKLIDLQATDDYLKDIREFRTQKQKGYSYIQDVLMGTVTDHGLDQRVIVLPKSLRAEIIQIAHNHTGHFGIAHIRSHK